MATSRAKAPIGSAQWFLNERRQANELVEQEVEEFTYSVRNELEWLNEHMSEIYSSNRLNVTDIFKTPGKLRGKTPRTARKKNVLQDRAPLTDIFAPNSQPRASPAKATQFQKRVEQFQIAEDKAVRSPIRSPQKPLYVASGKENHDSGYHGSQEAEDMEVEFPLPPTKAKQSDAPQVQSTARDDPSRAATEEQDSFVSAKEKLGSKNSSMDNLREGSSDTVPDATVNVLPPQPQSLENVSEIAKPLERQTSTEAPAQTESTVHIHEDAPDPMELDDGRSASDASSPEKPLLRKSSLTFASLPAREPLNGKQSIGNRVSRTSHLEQYKSSTYGATTQLGRTTGGKSLGASHIQLHDDDDQSDTENSRPTLSRIESETTKLHNKTSTQRLHDAISKLGQTKEPRPSKSIPNFAAQRASAVIYPNLANAGEKTGPMEAPAVPLKDHVPTARVVKDEDEEEEEEDDWIAPVNPPNKSTQQQADKAPMATFASSNMVNSSTMDDPFVLRLPQQRSPERAASPPRTYGHVKSISASAMPSPTRPAMALDAQHKKAISVSNPDVPMPQDTTTPAGSPTRKYMDAPLSASKSKLYSVLKSAKSLFASSAAASAQAKFEALSPNRSRTHLPGTFEEPLISPDPELQPTPALYPVIESSASESTRPASPVRKTRSSSEREKQDKRSQKEAEVKQRSASDLEKAREKERQKAASQMAQKSKGAAKDSESSEDMPPPPPPKSLLPQTKAREPRRMMKPSKETLNKSTGPPKPLTVHLASQRMQHQPNTAALSASLHESLPPPPPPKQQQAVSNKTSSSTLHSQSSSNTLKSSTSSQASRPKALEAAARKKELEEKAAQKKLEQKRELEQRRAAKLEEERKADQQRKEEEQRRVLEAKKAAQKKAEDARRQEQQRKEASRPASRQATELANALHQERAQPPTGYQRPGLGSARPLSQMKLTQDSGRQLPVNQAKPAKRPFQGEADEAQPARPAVQRNPPSYQQLDAKRRKTIEDEENDEPRRSVMAPPIRHSNIRKEPNKPPYGYMTAPQPPSHSSMFKSAVNVQHQQQHAQPAVKLPNGHPHQYANARIPFADAMNTAPSASTITANSQTYKTPLRPEGPSKPMHSAAKSSPHYPDTGSIALPDIATDSEDEDSDNEFAAPSWVASPFLNEALSQQQLVDPESVFGPVAELKMDEIFKNKERQKKWRERTSSALWTADRLTEEERRRDREGRERLMREGGWSFNTLQE